MFGEGLVRQGDSNTMLYHCMWQVGTDQNIRIFKDYWLPVFIPFTTGGDLDYDVVISELVDTEVP